MSEALGVPWELLWKAINAFPAASFVVLLWMILASLGMLRRQRERNIRSDSLDKARDSFDKAKDDYTERLSEDLKETKAELAAVRAEVRAIASERAALFALSRDNSTKVGVLEGEMSAVKAENQRLRDQNDLQASQLAQQSAQLVHCDKEAQRSLEKIRNLEQQVRELQAQQHGGGSGAATMLVAGAMQEGAASKMDDAAHMMRDAAARIKDGDDD